MLDCVVKNGKLVIPQVGILEAWIGIEKERIKIVSDEKATPEAKKIIDAKGRYIFPGLVDPHTHFGNHLPFYEDFDTETVVAAAGGVTTFLTVLKVGLFDPEYPSYFKIFPGILEKTKGLSSVDFSFHFHIPVDKHIEEIPDYYRELGIQSYKFHMTYKNVAAASGVTDVAAHLKKMNPGVDDGVIYQILKKVGGMEIPPVPAVHCEADEIIRYTEEEAHRQGLTGLKAWNEARPYFTEELAVMKAGYLARITKSPVYIVHLSTKEGLEVVRAEKIRGTKIIAETCVHYLSMNDEEMSPFGKINPPIRSQEHVEKLWEGILDGSITCVGTDHGAKHRSTKMKDIWGASLGFPGMETTLAIMIDESRKRGIPLTKVAEVCSYNNAKVFSLLPQKGTICPGSDADLVFVDMEKEVVISPDILHSISGFSPYEGRKVKGWPVLTMLRGEVIYENGKMVKKGSGEFVPRYPRKKDVS